MVKAIGEVLERIIAPMKAYPVFNARQGVVLSDKAAVVFFFIAAIATAILKRPETALATLLFGVTLFSVSRLGKGLRVQDVQAFAAVNAFILCMWAIVPWTTPGKTLFVFGPATVTIEGIRLCLAVTLKSNAVFLFFLTFISQRSIVALASVFQGLGMPEKLTVLITVMVRQITYFKNEWRVLKEAAELRGFVPCFNRATYRTTAALLSLIFIRTFERSRILNEALQLRGFSGTWPQRSVASMSVWEKRGGWVLFAVFVGLLLWDWEAVLWLTHQF